MNAMIRIIRVSCCAAIAFFILAVFGGATSVRAQQSAPTTVITWRVTGSYVPSSYIGKVLPNSESAITASVMVFDNGKIANVSGDTVYWYLNNTPLGGGPGATSFTFTPFAGSGSAATLKVEIPDYPGGLIIKTTPIYITAPIAVIRTLYPAATFSANPLIASADPYFFPATSANQLSYEWSVNSQAISGAENPDVLHVSLGPGTTAGSRFDITLSVAAGNSTIATDEKILTYQPLP